MEKIKLEGLELNPFEVIKNDHFLITAGDGSRFNTMTAGWGGFGVLWGKPVVFIFVRESRYTLEFLDKSKSFSLSFFPPEYSKALEYCGSHSGRYEDKVKNAYLTPVEVDDTVSFDEANLILTCNKIGKTFLDKSTILDPSCLSHYPHDDYHYMYIGEVKGVYIN